MNEERIKNARALLKKEGFFVDNLWHTDDVTSKFETKDMELCQKILYSALTCEIVMDEIQSAISYFGEEEKLKERTDE